MVEDVQRASVLVVGEALTDIVVSDGVSREHAGGSPFNVAVTLGRLGDDVSLLTAIGDDARGREIIDQLDDSSVTLIPDSIRGGSTSSARATIGRDGSASYEFDIDWSLPAEPDLPGSAVTHAASIALFLEPGASSVAQLIRSRAARSLISIDPNIRAALVGRHSAAVDRFESLLPVVDLVKLSDEDADWLYPKMSIEDVLTRLIARGPSLAIVTRGGEGSDLASADARAHIDSPPTTVADTIGAGDSYMGAVIHGVLTSRLRTDLRSGAPAGADDLSELGRFAARVAAITVSRHGANPPRLAELE